MGSLLHGFQYNNLILSALRKVATVAMNFDPSVLVLCWKGVGKVLILVKDNYPHVSSVVKELCVAMEIKSSDCFDCAPAANSDVVDPSFQKLMKVCRFLGTMLVKLTRVSERCYYCSLASTVLCGCMVSGVYSTQPCCRSTPAVTGCSWQG